MTLRDQLLELQEPKYMKFTAALMPGVENVLGIRLPVLRKIARQIAAGDWRTYLAEAEDFYFEERMLQGLGIGCSRCGNSYSPISDPKPNTTCVSPW